MDTAQEDSWKTLPMPKEAGVLEYSAAFSRAEFERMARGLIPLGMDDKWFVCLDGDVLSFHRSWTGICIYHVEFETKGEQHAVRRVRVNRDPEQYGETDDAYDSKLLHWIMSSLLLGKKVEFPLPENLPADAPTHAYQHSIAGTAYPERAAKTKPWCKFW